MHNCDRLTDFEAQLRVEAKRARVVRGLTRIVGVSAYPRERSRTSIMAAPAIAHEMAMRRGIL